MAFDPTRPIPWRRLLTEWFFSSMLIGIVMLIVPSTRTPAVAVAILVGGAVYLGVGIVLAKFGYERAALNLRGGPRQSASAGTPARQAARPAPTSRTNSGNRQPRRR
jgi:hypothetical protein